MPACRDTRVVSVRTGVPASTSIVTRTWPQIVAAPAAMSSTLPHSDAVDVDLGAGLEAHDAVVRSRSCSDRGDARSEARRTRRARPRRARRWRRERSRPGSARLLVGHRGPRVEEVVDVVVVGLLELGDRAAPRRVPSPNITARSAIARMLSSSWVTTTIVTPSTSRNRSSVSSSSAATTGSRPADGSSQKMISGSRIDARASAARLRWPPDRLAGRRCSSPASPTSASLHPHHLARSAASGSLRQLAQRQRDVVERPSSRRTARPAGTRCRCGAAACAALSASSAYSDLAEQHDLAGERRLQPGDRAQQRRLAAARAAEQRDDLAAPRPRGRSPASTGWSS